MEVQKDFRDLLELLNAPTPSQDDLVWIRQWFW